MSFHEVQFPTTISYGSRGGPGHNNLVVELDGGAEERIARWTDPRAVYDIAYAIKSMQDLAEVIKFARARQGSIHGFRFKDWSDFTSASDGVSAHARSDVTIGTGDGSTTTFQLVKTYTSGGTTRTRRIEKPIIATVLIEVAGSLVTSGYSVNSTTGVVTFSTAPTIGQTVKAGFEFDVPVRFGEEVDAMLEVSLEAYNEGSVPRLTAVELKNEVPIDEDFFYGGAQTFDPFASDVAITPGDGRVLLFNPTGAGRIVSLPNPSAYQTGGPYFFVVNLSGANTFDIRYSGSTILTVPTNGAAYVVLGLDGAGAKTWYAF